jgi:hypothetical protein
MPILCVEMETAPCKVPQSAAKCESFEISYGRASIIFIFGPLLSGIPHLMKDIERKERHPLFLVGAQSLIQRLPRTGQFFEVG